MSVIGIQLDGDTEFLDTQEDTSIEVTLNNPLLGDADVLSPGSYTLPFNLPSGILSPKNAAKLKHPEVLENNAAFALQGASLFIHGVPFKKGNIKSSATDDKNILSSNFLFGLSQINPNIKTARLRDLLNEEVVISDVQRVKKIYLKKFVDADWSVTINGKNYSGPNINAFVGHINDDWAAATAVIDGHRHYSVFAELRASGPSSPGGLAAPYVILYSQIPGLTIVDPPTLNPDPLAEVSASVDESVTSDYAFESFDMTDYYNDFQTFIADYLSGDFPSDKYRFPVLFNASLYEGDQPCVKTSEVINGVSSAGLIINDWLALKNHNTLQPVVLLKYALSKIATAFGFEWEGDFWEDAELPNFFIDSSATLDKPMDYIGNSKYVFWRRSFNINEFVPDISVIEFLKGIASRYNLAVYPNETTLKVRMKYRENTAISNAYDDITEFASPVKGVEEKRVTGYNLLCNKEESDLLSVNESVTVGIAQETIPITCGRLFQTGQFFTDGLITGPRVSRKNNEQRFGLRVFHFLGMKDNGVFTYQAADINGTDFNENLSGSNGLYARYFKYWLNFKKDWRLITLTLSWPLRKLLRFDYEMKQRFDRSNYIVSTIKLKVTNKSVQASEVQLYTMK